MALSEARKRANKKWNDANMKDRYDRIQLIVPKGQKAVIQAAAERHGQSVNGYITSLIAAALERETEQGGGGFGFSGSEGPQD
jgi:predicted HicB family RNase H-like nuclease